MATAIVSGALANKPGNGGEAWVRLSWLLGLRRLGFEVYFAEQLSGTACVDDSGRPVGFRDSANLAHFEAVVRDFGLEGRAGLICDSGGAGLSREELTEVAAGADVIFNLSGHLSAKEIMAGPALRVYVDLDPGFTQAWHADDSLPFRLAGHDRYVTVGLNVGVPEWPWPLAGIEWIPTLPPVVLEEWPRSPPSPGRLRFTTVATWRSPYGGLEIGGRRMSLKHHQWRRMAELPERVQAADFELALDIHPGDSRDIETLLDHGWKLVDPKREAATPMAFREYVRRSGAEFSVAQGVYVESGSGWFSDRTAAYLACGRPALVQDTGLGQALPLGQGLVAFSSLEQAAAEAERMAANLGSHGEAARQLAESCLGSDLVLGRLLARLGVGG